MHEDLSKEANIASSLFKGFKKRFLETAPKVKSLNSDVHLSGTTARNAPTSTKWYSPEEVKLGQREADLEEGNGAILDVTGWIAKNTGNVVARAIKGDKNVIWSGTNTINDASVKSKQTIRDWTTRSGQKVIDAIGGNKPGSMRGKMFSKLEDTRIGERQMADGSVMPIFEKRRRADITAPFDHAVKVGTPLFAASYVGEKLMGDKAEEQTRNQVANGVIQASTEIPRTIGPSFSPMPRQAAEEWEEQLEKQAFFDKVAHYERQLMTKEAKISTLQSERIQFEKLAQTEQHRADEMEKMATELESELQEKKAAHEELVLRASAAKRSESAVKIATNMLRGGMIKQAEYRSKIDELMDCSEDALNIFEKMADSSKSVEESIETLAFMHEDNISKKASAHSSLTPGISVKGQTIGEAARSIQS